MSEIQNRWRRATDREKWAARGASFVAKAKATKVVWFPPKPVKAGKAAASTAKKTAKKTGKKTAGAATKTAKKSSGAGKKITSPVRRKKA